jgi:hypothetical protein
MTPTQSTRIALAFLFAVFAAGGARAEDWQDTRHTTLIDVDSITKESDGLVTFLEKEKYHDEEDGPNTPRKAAVDCSKRISYSSYSMQYESDWRSKGVKVIPGTMGEQLLDFVCSRVR